MSWPLSSVGEPNFRVGPGQAIPTGAPVALTTAKVWLLGLHLTNTLDVQRTVTVRDKDGNTLAIVVVPGNKEVPYEWAFRPASGVSWGADGANIVGDLWGYQ